MYIVNVDQSIFSLLLILTNQQAPLGIATNS